MGLHSSQDPAPDASTSSTTGASISIAQTGEFALIHRVTTGQPQSAYTLLGPGDDAAVLAQPDGRTVASTDMLVERVHFRLDWSTPYQVGRKAVAVNLSDIAAMGAVPSGLLVGVGCDADSSTSLIDDLSAGMWEEARSVGVSLVGGDFVSAPVLSISVTALGDLQGRAPVTRSGAQPGDVVAVAGRLGWAAAGLAVLGRGFRSPVAVVGAQRIPEPPYRAGPAAAEAGAHSMVDTSDGLLADLGHIAAASGVSIDVRTELIEVPQRLTEVASALGADARHWVLTGGEDHALVATFPAGRDIPAEFRPIGTVGEGQAVTVDGARYEESPGWSHFQ